MSSNAACVLANAGPLMALGKLNRLDLLARVYGVVGMTRAVYEEVVIQGLARGFDDALAVQLFWRKHQWPVVDLSGSVFSRFEPTTILGAGERQLLALASIVSPPLVLLDDELARAEARRLKLPVKGTLGVLVDAHRQNHLSWDDLDLLIQEISARSDIWISADLCQGVLDAVRPARDGTRPD